MPLGGVDGVFMSIVPVLLTGPEGKCFEEVRIDDYIKAYQATGQPPAPCPPEPTDADARKALNLPSLFVPHSMGPTGPLPVTLPPSILALSPGVGTPSSTPSSGGAGLFSFSGSAGLSTGTSTGALALSTTKPKITNPADIPAVQEFTARVVPGGTSGGVNETFESICGMDDYLFFSLDELRYYAYMRGQKTAPPGIKMHPYVVPTKDVSSGTPVPGSNELLQCLSANPLYEKHSTEELRIAYLLSQREMTSAELLQGVPSVLPPITSGVIPPATPLQIGAPPPTTTPLQLGTPITPLQIGAAPGISGLGSLTPATPLALGAPQPAASSLFGGTPTTTTPSTAPRFSFNFR